MSRGFADESIVMTMTTLTAMYGRPTAVLSIETLGPARAVKRHPQSPQAVTLTPLCGRCQLHFCRSNAAQTAPRRRLESADERPERLVTEPHRGPRVAVRCLGVV